MGSLRIPLTRTDVGALLYRYWTVLMKYGGKSCFSMEDFVVGLFLVEGDDGPVLLENSAVVDCKFGQCYEVVDVTTFNETCLVSMY